MTGVWQDLRAASALVRVVITLRVMKDDLAERDHDNAGQKKGSARKRGARKGVILLFHEKVE